MVFTKKQLIALLKENNAQQPKAKYSNNTILAMLSCLNDDFTCNVELTRNGYHPNAFMVNRGSLVECIIKSVVLDESYIYSKGAQYVHSQYANSKKHYEVQKSLHLQADLNTIGLSKKQLALVNGLEDENIEIKFCSSFAPATYNNRKEGYTIIACPQGIYIIESKKIVWTKAGKLNVNNQHASDLIELEALEEKLGYHKDND